MNDKEEIKIRKESIKRRTRIYLYSGIILLGTGVICLYFSRLGFILIAGGIIFRILYYLGKFDLKTIDRIEQRLNSFTMFFLPLLLIFGISHQATALDPGDKADELDRLIWIQGEPVKLSTEAETEKKLIVINLLATFDQGSGLSLPVLSAIQKKFKRENIIVIAISKETEEAIKDYLAKNQQNITFNFAKDPSGLTFDRYIGTDARIPLTFIVGKNGKIMWRGHPFEVEQILKKILAGSFDQKKQFEISELHKQLQGFLQIEDIVQAIKTADKILAIDPADDIAMRVRLFVYESKNELNEALQFITGLIEKNPGNFPIYLIKLDLLERNNAPVEDIHKIVNEIAEKFKDNHEALSQLAWICVNRLRFGAIPLKAALDASKRSIELLVEEKEQDPAKLAQYLSTQAKIYYLTGALEQAIKTQEKVLRLQKGDSSETEAEQLLQYYQNALKLREQEK